MNLAYLLYLLSVCVLLDSTTHYYYYYY